MDKHPLIKQSEVFKKEAVLLLKKSKVLELLKPYSRVQFSGAYHLNLMLNGDIDIHVINPEITKERAVEVLNGLIDKGFFRGYLFFDWVKFRKPEFPKGYYIGLKTRFNRRKWKIDVWFIKKIDRKEAKLMKLIEENLTEKNKLVILKLKDKRNKEKPKLSSVLIYRAVLEKGVTDFKELLKLA